MQRDVGDLGPEAHQVVREAIKRAYAELAKAASGGSPRGLDDLLRAVTPPQWPIDSGPEDDDAWQDAELRLGLELPLDFKQVIRAYGAGDWGRCLRILNPFSRDPELNLERRAHDILAKDHDLRRRFPGDLPFALYPEKGGLFPWAVTTSGVRCYWLTEGAAGSWPIIVFEANGFLYDRYQPTVTDFLFRFVSGALSSRVIGTLEPVYRWTFVANHGNDGGS